MAIATMESRVSSLEALMAELTSNVNRLSIEMREFKDEMREFKDEMSEYKEWSRNQIKTMNRQWGDLANKMGTLAEDLVAPSVPRILRDYVGCPESGVEFVTVRFRGKKMTGEMQEFDVLAGCGNTLLINETKTTLRPKDVDEFVAMLAQARVYSGIRRQTNRWGPGIVLYRPNAHSLRRTPGANHARRNRWHHGSAQ